jgi:hypothetical protein
MAVTLYMGPTCQCNLLSILLNILSNTLSSSMSLCLSAVVQRARDEDAAQWTSKVKHIEAREARADGVHRPGVTAACGPGSRRRAGWARGGTPVEHAAARRPSSGWCAGGAPGDVQAGLVAARAEPKAARAGGVQVQGGVRERVKFPGWRRGRCSGWRCSGRCYGRRRRDAVRAKAILRTTGDGKSTEGNRSRWVQPIFLNRLLPDL